MSANHTSAVHHQFLVPHGLSVPLPSATVASTVASQLAAVLKEQVRRFASDSNGADALFEATRGYEKGEDAARLLCMLQRIGWHQLHALYQVLGSTARVPTPLKLTADELRICGKPNFAHALGIYRFVHMLLGRCIAALPSANGTAEASQYLVHMRGLLEGELRDCYKQYTAISIGLWATMSSGWQLTKVYEADIVLRSFNQESRIELKEYAWTVPGITEA